MRKLTICSTKALDPMPLHLLHENDIKVIISNHSEVSYSRSAETVNKMSGLSGAVVCTSQHAVKGLMLYDVDLKQITGIFCLAGATKTTAQGIAVPILGTATDATALALKIYESGIQSITFLCAESHRMELPEILFKYGIHVHLLKVYSTQVDVQKIDEPFDFVLFFSPHAVDVFLQKNKLLAGVICFCIGQTTAQFLRLKTNNEIIVSPFPSQEHLVNQVIRKAQSINNNQKPDYAVVKTV